MNSLKDWAKAAVVSHDIKMCPPKVIQCDKLTLKRNRIELVPESKNDACNLPFAATDSFHATALLQNKYIRPDGKDMITAIIKFPGSVRVDYHPGDTIGILPENKASDVEKLLLQFDYNADELIEIAENRDAKRKYLPKVTTPRIIFQKYLNIHGVPMKQAIATLAQYTSNEDERRKMNYLASPQGADDYTAIILNCGTSYLDLFLQFKSCCPPLEILLQLMPRLLPRPYSIASSPLVDPDKIRVVFSILPAEKEGVCTGMLRRALSEGTECTLCVYLRKTNGFRMVEDESTPLVLVGPGSGVAPYLGFLAQLQSTARKRSVYLFTGFRKPDEFLFKEEIEEYLIAGVLTKLFVSYSREEESHTKYVQEAIKEHWVEIGRAIIEENGRIYECGDFKKMSETVTDAFAVAVGKYLQVNSEEAVGKIKELKTNKRYLQDIWS